MTPAIYLDDVRFRDWAALYRIAKHPQFFYRALNDKNAWVAWRVTRYILKAKVGAHFAAARRIVKAVRLVDTQELIGCVVLVDLHKNKTGQAETGTFIAVPYQKQKIGTQARLRFLDWCLATFDLRFLEATVHPDNHASIRMLEYSGMKQTGTLDADCHLYAGRDGQWEPRIIMSAQRSDIEQALTAARSCGLYSCAILVL